MKKIQGHTISPWISLAVFQNGLIHYTYTLYIYIHIYIIHIVYMHVCIHYTWTCMCVYTIHVYACECEWVCMHYTCILCIYVCEGYSPDNLTLGFWLAFSFSFFRTGSLTALELLSLARLASCASARGPQASTTYSLPSAWGFTWLRALWPIYVKHCNLYLKAWLYEIEVSGERGESVFCTWEVPGAPCVASLSHGSFVLRKHFPVL